MSHQEKLDWANEHLNKAFATFIEFGKTNPYRTTTDKDESFAGNQKVERLFVRAFCDKPLPESIGFDVGDCAHNLRSALDHLAYTLAGGSTVNDTTVQFPIFTKETDYKSRLGKLKNIPPGAVTIMDSLQPYHRGDTADSGLLAMLSTLDNVDKHRRVLLTSSIASLKAIEVSERKGAVEILVHGRNGVAFENGAIVSTLEVILKHPGATVHVDFETVYAVALTEPAPFFERDVFKLLYEIGHYIAQDVFPRFEPFL